MPESPNARFVSSKELLVRPTKLVPFFCHTYVNGPVPAGLGTNNALESIARTRLVIAGTETSVRTASVALFVTELCPPVRMSVYVPASAEDTVERVRELVVLPESTTPLFSHLKE